MILLNIILLWVRLFSFSFACGRLKKKKGGTPLVPFWFFCLLSFCLSLSLLLFGLRRSQTRRKKGARRLSPFCFPLCRCWFSEALRALRFGREFEQKKGRPALPLFFFLCNANICGNTYIGTIGAGNHFAELQLIEEIKDKELFEELGLDENKLYLTVHSGSRGFGKDILGNIRRAPLLCICLFLLPSPPSSSLKRNKKKQKKHSKAHETFQNRRTQGRNRRIQRIHGSP